MKRCPNCKRKMQVAVWVKWYVCKRCDISIPLNEKEIKIVDEWCRERVARLADATRLV